MRVTLIGTYHSKSGLPWALELATNLEGPDLGMNGNRAGVCVVGEGGNGPFPGVNSLLFPGNSWSSSSGEPSVAPQSMLGSSFSPLFNPKSILKCGTLY
jgi:hypothetical protein